MTEMNDLAVPPITLNARHAARWLDCQRRAAFLEQERPAAEGVPVRAVLKDCLINDLQGNPAAMPGRIIYDTMIRSEKELEANRKRALMMATRELAVAGISIKPGTRTIEKTFDGSPGLTLVAEPDLEGMDINGREVIILLYLDERHVSTTVPEFACLWACFSRWEAGVEVKFASLTVPAFPITGKREPLLTFHGNHDEMIWARVYREIIEARAYSIDRSPLANPSSNKCWKCRNEFCDYHKLRNKT